ncbi:hypothetical protein EDB84DRAFT_1533314 [Lactarius hengduanensis]|nr:hypothetical protein EDB84DRAFT_1533314 [Lactarius hengduanensis]
MDARNFQIALSVTSLVLSRTFKAAKAQLTRRSRPTVTIVATTLPTSPPPLVHAGYLARPPLLRHRIKQKNQVAVSGGFQLSCLSPPMHPFTATGAATTSTVSCVHVHHTQQQWRQVIPPRCPVLLVIDDLGVRIKNFGLDPSQDLIVFLEYHPAASASSSAPNSGAGVCVHLRRLSASDCDCTCTPLLLPLAVCTIDDDDGVHNSTPHCHRGTAHVYRR